MTCNIHYHEYSRKTRIAAERYDRFYTKFSDFEDDRGILMPKIEGNWRLVFVDIRYNELCQLIAMELPSNWEVTVFARKETLSASGAVSPENTIKPYDEFMKTMIAEFPKPIDDKAANEIYRRCNGDLELIATTLVSLKELPASRIRMEEVNSVIAPSNTVWASDVVASIFVYYNERIPKRGHPLAMAKWKQPLSLLNSLTETLGQDIAFYSIQKQLRFLFETKVKYLRNQPLGSINKQQENLLSEVDVYSAMYAYLLFRLSKPPALQAIITDILNRQKGSNKEVSLLHDCIYRE